MNAPIKPNPLLSAPVLPTISKLALPNAIGMTASTLVTIAEPVYAGSLGTPALAGLALVFPMIMLMQTMSAGAMGGGVSSAVARALGAGDEARANAIVLHAIVISLTAGLIFSLLFLLFGEFLYRLLGGQGEALRRAMDYSNVAFAGAIAVWMMNTLASTVRGSGNMRTPGMTMLAVAALQIAIGGGLALGLGPLPNMGMAGIGAGLALANAIGALYLLWLVLSGRTRARIDMKALRLRGEYFRDILRVGGIALISPVQTIATVLVLTRLMAWFGEEALAGYGIGARLEFLLIPITFAIGGACVPLAGMAMGAKNVERAYRIAWTGGAMAAVLIGVIGIAVAVAPWLWSGMFSRSPAVREAADLYLRIAGPAFAFFGLGHGLYFASQGLGKIIGPILAGTLRLAIIALGGWLLAINAMPAWTMFALVAFAMLVYGAGCALALHLGHPKA